MDFEPLIEAVTTPARFIELFGCLMNQATTEGLSGDSALVDVWSSFSILKIQAEKKSDDRDHHPPDWRQRHNRNPKSRISSHV